MVHNPPVLAELTAHVLAGQALSDAQVAVAVVMLTDGSVGAEPKADFLAGLVAVDTRGWAITVFNALSWSRTDVLTVTADLSGIPTPGLRLRDLAGNDVPFVVEHARRSGDGNLGEVTLRLLASDVPSVGHRTWALEPADTLPEGSTWRAADGDQISTEAYRVQVDPARQLHRPSG